MIILLDIDGVLIKGNSWDKLNIMEDGFPEFNFKSIKALQKILDSTKATVVLTTSHKSRYTISEWESIFLKRGIKLEKLSKLTDNKFDVSREEEIINWIMENDINNVIIIDDDARLNDLKKVYKDKLILTCSSIGLTDEDANKAIKILNNEN